MKSLRYLYILMPTLLLTSCASHQPPELQPFVFEPQAFTFNEEEPMQITYFGDSLTDTTRELTFTAQEQNPNVNNFWFMAQSGWQNQPVSSLENPSGLSAFTGTWANFVVLNLDNANDEIIPWEVSQQDRRLNITQINNDYAFISALSVDGFTNDKDSDDPSIINSDCVVPGLLEPRNVMSSSCVPGYIKQVNMYLDNLNGRPIPESTLYITWIGSNDLLAALQNTINVMSLVMPELTQEQKRIGTLSTDEANLFNEMQMLKNRGVSYDNDRWVSTISSFLFQAVDNSLDNIDVGITEMSDAGASSNQMVLFDIPELANVPAAIDLINLPVVGPLIIEPLIRRITLRFNTGLMQTANNHRINLFSTDNVLQTVLADPQSFGFDPSKTTTSCVAENAFPLCEAGRGPAGEQLFYMFTDDTGHPTVQLHKVLGDAVTVAIKDTAL